MFLKILGLQKIVPNTSLGSWFIVLSHAFAVWAGKALRFYFLERRDKFHLTKKI